MRWSILISLLSAGIVYMSGVLIASLISRSLGTEQVADWALISSIVALLPVLEIGIGSALFSTLVALKGRRILDLYNRIYQLLRFIIKVHLFVLGGGLLLFAVDVKWDFNVVGDKYYIYVLFFISPILVFVSIVEKVHASRKNWSHVKLIDGLTTAIVTSVLYVYAGLYGVTILSVVLIRYVLVACIKWLVYYSYLSNIKRRFERYRNNRNNWLQVSLPEIKSYFSMSFVGAFALSSDTVLIAIFCSPADVSEYYAAQRIFLPLSMFFGIISPLLWFKFSKIFNEKNGLIRLKKIFIRLVFLVFVTSIIFGLIVLYYMDLIVSKWLDDSVAISKAMGLGHFFWMLLVSYGSLLSPIANSMSMHNLMAVLSFLMLLCNLILTIGGLVYFGAPAAIYASILSTLILISIPLTYAIFKNEAGVLATNKEVI